MVYSLGWTLVQSMRIHHGDRIVNGAVPGSKEGAKGQRGKEEGNDAEIPHGWAGEFGFFC